ncbi:hypothetical protein Tco_0531729 [Tanacetum coccineum]
MSSYNHFGCSCCGGPFNGGNCPGCSSVGSENEFVYDPNPYSYNDTPNFFNQPPQHQYETYSCEFCGGNPHTGFDCQTGNTPVFDQGPCYNQDFDFNQPPFNSPSQPQQFDCCEFCGGPHYSNDCQAGNMPFYDQGPCYNQNFSDDQPPFYSSYQQQQFNCCEVCRGPYYSSDCQTRNKLVYEPNPGNNYDFPCFDQPPQYHIDQSPPQDLIFDSLMHTCKENSRILEEMLITQMRNSPVVLNEPEGSDDYTEVTYDKEQCLSDHYTASVTPPAYTPFIPFLATMEPTDTLLMGDEVISIIPARETDEFIKSSVDDLVLIPREFEVTSDSVLKCDMPATTSLPPTDDGEVDFDINSPLGEQVVVFLMENVDVAGLPRHLVKRHFSHLLKNPSLTKGMSDEPLGDDTKPRSFDATFPNPLFDFNDDFTLCNDNPLFDEEFEDISSLDLPKLTPVIDESTLLVTLPSPYLVVLGDEKIDLLLRDDLDTLLNGDREIDFNPCRDIEELECLLAKDLVPVPRVFDEPLGNSDSMFRSSETSDLFEELIAEFGLDDSIPSDLISTDIDGRYYDSEGNILYFEQLLNEDTSSDVSQALLPTESSLLVPPLPDPKQIYLFFSLAQSGGKTRVMETPSFSSHHMPSPRPTAYSPKEVMYCYYHRHLTSGDGFDLYPSNRYHYCFCTNGYPKLLSTRDLLYGFFRLCINHRKPYGDKSNREPGRRSLNVGRL